MSLEPTFCPECGDDFDATQQLRDELNPISCQTCRLPLIACPGCREIYDATELRETLCVDLSTTVAPCRKCGHPIGVGAIEIGARLVEAQLSLSEVVNTENLSTYIEKEFGRKSNSRCFVASVVYSPDSEEVKVLRKFRNRFLLKHSIGMRVMQMYYAHGPFWAQHVAQSDNTKRFIRLLLNCLISLARFLVERRNKN